LGNPRNEKTSAKRTKKDLEMVLKKTISRNERRRFPGPVFTRILKEMCSKLSVKVCHGHKKHRRFPQYPLVDYIRNRLDRRRDIFSALAPHFIRLEGYEWERRGMHIGYWWESQKERDH
jgi:hypothetical protein